jgi:GNAT superfamily N-acetyltransferase
MKKERRYTIRKMKPDEVETIAIHMATEEGWNPGLHDAHCYYNTDANGFFVGLLDEEPISCISAIAYGQEFGFIGFYIVKPAYRGMGYGIKIWNVALDYLNARNIGLDGVIEQQANYKKSGFKLAYNNFRYQGVTQTTHDDFSDVVPVTEALFDKLLVYDSHLFPAPRPHFLKCWLNQPDASALTVIQNGVPKGFGVIRTCKIGYKIGPLFADHLAVAEKLFLALCNTLAPGSTFFLDIPEPNPEAKKLVDKYKMHEVFGTARMYTKYEPDIDLNKVFGVTTFELG